MTEAEYHKSRLAFAYIGGRLYVIKDDERSHKQWLSDVFGIRGEKFEKIPRGCVEGDLIKLYIGSDFTPIVPDDLADDIALEVADYLKYEGKYGLYHVGNGLTVGEPGESWSILSKLPDIEVIAP